VDKYCILVWIKLTDQVIHNLSTAYRVYTQVLPSYKIALMLLIVLTIFDLSTENSGLNYNN